MFGIVMISSVSVYSSYKVTSNSWNPSNAFYLLRSLSHLVMSFILFAFVVKTPYSFFEKYSKNFFIVWITLLAAVLFFWATYNWTKWWLNIPFLPSIQPVEFFKLFFIIYLASYIKKKKTELKDFKKWFLSFVWLLWVIVLLLWAQPDFWSILIIAPVSIMLFYLGWWNTKYLFISFVIWISFVLSIYNLGKHTTPENRNMFSYITDRMDSFMSDKKKIAESNEAADFQIKQWLIAIWSWWFFWLWFGNSIQKYGYLPEVQWDFIFSVIAEEFGFMWIFFLISMYLFIGYRWFLISKSVDDPYGKYLSFWITCLILFQAFLNIWVNLNIVPLTWVTLPFISYGWTSLMSLSIWVGIILAISRHADYNKMNYQNMFSVSKDRFSRFRIKS